MSEAEKYLFTLALEVQKLIHLHRRAFEQLDRAAVPAFHSQLQTVATMADLAVLVINLPAIPTEVVK